MGLKDKLLDWRWWFGLAPNFASEEAKDRSLTVVIPAYNEEDAIGNTIDNIINNVSGVNEIIVVDDCSCDQTGEIAKSKGVAVIRTPENQGTKAKAQNYVLGMIKTNLFVTIDADTILAPDAIDKILPYFNNPNTASVCGFVIPQKIETLWERGRYIEYLFGIMIQKRAQNNIGLVLVSSGCFSVFRTDLVEKMGGFKSRTMAEDMDLTWEFLLKNYDIYCVQDSYCYPLDPPTFDIFVKQIDRWYRSFFQNISEHSFKENRKLGFLIYSYLLDSMLSPVIGILILYFLSGNLLFALGMGLLIDSVVVLVPCLIKGSRIGMFWKTLTSFPCYFVICKVNLFVFWRSLWKEWIKKERLTSWSKGH